MTASRFTSTAPPEDWTCQNCGKTSAETGRFRKAMNHELHEGDEEGDVYECSTCGSQMAVPPDANELTGGAAMRDGCRNASSNPRTRLPVARPCKRACAELVNLANL